MMARKLGVRYVPKAIRWVLQWGRANDGAEIPSLNPSVMPSYTLQWGRANDGAEIGSLPTGKTVSAWALMGPRL